MKLEDELKQKGFIRLTQDNFYRYNLVGLHFCGYFKLGWYNPNTHETIGYCALMQQPCCHNALDWQNCKYYRMVMRRWKT